MTRAPAHKFYVTPKDIVHSVIRHELTFIELCTNYLVSMHVQYIIYLYLNTFIVECYYTINDLLQCNYCDTSSPHNAMHLSLQIQAFEKGMALSVALDFLINTIYLISYSLAALVFHFKKGE